MTVGAGLAVGIPLAAAVTTAGIALIKFASNGKVGNGNNFVPRHEIDARFGNIESSLESIRDMLVKYIFKQ